MKSTDEKHHCSKGSIPLRERDEMIRKSCSVSKGSGKGQSRQGNQLCHVGPDTQILHANPGTLKQLEGLESRGCFAKLRASHIALYGQQHGCNCSKSSVAESGESESQPRYSGNI